MFSTVDGDYWRIAPNANGDDALVWNEKDVGQNCPGRETGDWGYWDDEILGSIKNL